MQQSKAMLVAAALGLGLGIPLALEGWEGLKGVLTFLEQQSARMLGVILVGLSITVLIRQVRSRPAAAPQRPGTSHTSSAAEAKPDVVAEPGAPPG
jgi:hypothetical protein